MRAAEMLVRHRSGTKCKKYSLAHLFDFKLSAFQGYLFSFIQQKSFSQDRNASSKFVLPQYCIVCIYLTRVTTVHLKCL